MNEEKKLATELLRLTATGVVNRKSLTKHLNIPLSVIDELLTKFQVIDLIGNTAEGITASSVQRINLVLHALTYGADAEKLCRLLKWSEFEDVTAKIFEANDFTVRTRFRFKWNGRRWEMDLLAMKDPVIVCVDCKCWKRGWNNAAITKAATAQKRRTQMLASAFGINEGNNNRIVQWSNATLVPMLLSLVPGPAKFYESVPIVPILQLQSFLHELPGYVQSMAHFTVNA